MFLRLVARLARISIDQVQPLVDSLSPDQRAQLAAAGVSSREIGDSAEGRSLHGCTIGDRQLPLVSIVAGAHPDEPAGPVAALELLRGWHQHPLRDRLRLAVVPLMDVDGVVAQRDWLRPWNGSMELHRFLRHRLRRPLGEDREFGWPGAPWGGEPLGECRAAAAFFDAQGPAVAHLSLHGMAQAAGAWFLLDRLAMCDATLWADLRRCARDHGFGLHDMPRHGDKGFRRAGPGFCTTPSGPHMRRWALAAGRDREAAAVAYGSMDAARARARAHGTAAQLCAVSEFPLLQLPPHPSGSWREELEKLALDGADAERCAAFLREHGGRCPPLADQVAGMLDMCTAVMGAARRLNPRAKNAAHS